MSALTSTVFSYQKPIAIAVEKMFPNLIINNESKARKKKKKKVIYFLFREEKKMAC